MLDISSIIKARRIVLGISQEDLAEMSGVSIATIKTIETGKANPSLRTLESLAVILGLELSLKVRNTY